MKNLLNSPDILFVALVGLQVLDIVTGLSCVKNRDPYDFKKLLLGGLKKLLDWGYILFAFLAAHIVSMLGHLIDIDLSFSHTLGWVALASILYAECRSVFDNLQCLGVPVPKVLSNMLLLTEKKFDGVLDISDVGAAGMSLKMDQTLEDLQNTDTVQIKVQK